MIALIDYGAGNTASVANVLKDLDVEFILTKKETEILRADKIILPGVGEASFAIRNLTLYNMVSFLRMIKKPLLGICLGMQLLCEFTEEGNTACLGIFNTTCKKFPNTVGKIPHMGWNKVKMDLSNPLFQSLNSEEYFYFANSFYVPVIKETVATVEHGIEFSASINKNNFYGVQFHPEKSGEIGIQVLKNFIRV